MNFDLYKIIENCNFDFNGQKKNACIIYPVNTLLDKFTFFVVDDTLLKPLL